MYAAVFVLSFSVAFACTVGGEDLSLSDEGTDKLHDFLELVLGVMPDIEDCRCDPHTEKGKDGLVVRLRCEDWHATVRVDTGIPCSFSRLRQADKSVPPSLLRKDAISATDAFQQFQPFLRMFNLPEDSDSYDLRLVDERERSSRADDEPKDLYGCFWDIGSDLEWNSMPCRGRRILAGMSAYTGELAHLVYLPVIPPYNTEITVRKEAALQQAHEWLSEMQYFNTEFREWRLGEDLSTIFPVVASQNKFPQPQGFDKDCAQTISFICLEVPFKFREGENWFEAAVWIHGETGEVIGGMHFRYGR